jgi:hypothetical protein
MGFLKVGAYDTDFMGAGAYTADTAIAVPLFGMVRQSIHFAVPHFCLRASIFTAYSLV